ncbi:hypothetical protein PoB_005334000 [Plakobranchus ocellatus]|uniref:Uncharacterized protein n=1 Tax=Plakobranchus ocellatus TaxID=259542 RepID=A0AAV4C5Y8_9GAST|nr:hypothetical protein PoB_005334000 [Plakobranchus ocellatus]
MRKGVNIQQCSNNQSFFVACAVGTVRCRTTDSDHVRTLGIWEAIRRKISVGGVSGTLASESALRSAGTLLSRVRARHRFPGLTEGLKA